MKKYFKNGSDGTIVAKQITIVDEDNEVKGIVEVVNGKVVITQIEDELTESPAPKKSKKTKVDASTVSNDDGGTSPKAGG